MKKDINAVEVLLQTAEKVLFLYPLNIHILNHSVRACVCVHMYLPGCSSIHSFALSTPPSLSKHFSQWSGWPMVYLFLDKPQELNPEDYIWLIHVMQNKQEFLCCTEAHSWSCLQATMSSVEQTFGIHSIGLFYKESAAFFPIELADRTWVHFLECVFLFIYFLISSWD